MRRWLPGFRRIRIFAVSNSGNVAIIAGLSMTMLVGFCGLGIDTGYWFYQQRQLQGAVDIAAFDAATALNAGSSVSDAGALAKSAAASNGWNSVNGTITINSPPTSGTHQTTNSVEVILTENVPRYFAAIYSSSSITIQTRAVGTKNGSHVACVIALSASGNPAINVTGSGNLDSPNCDVVSDSTTSNAISVGGNASLTAPCAVSVGSSTMSSGVQLTKCTAMTNNAPPATDPYASVPTPTIPGPCITLTGKPTTISPGYYCNGLSVNWSADTTFEPGLYYIAGGNLDINAQANVAGTGVTFYMAAGNTVSIGGGATTNFSAPTSSTTWTGTQNSPSSYSGITFFGDRSATSGNNSFGGGSAQSITGVIYFPTENVSYAGGSSSSSDCTQVVSYTLTVTGNADFNNTCPGDGMSTINVQDGAPGSVQLTE